MTPSTIKLISLNTWGGRSLYPLMSFLQRKAAETDIFCLQEVFETGQASVDARHPGEYVCASLFPKIAAVLPDFQGTFACFDDNRDRLSQAIFIRRSLAVKDVADFVVYKPLVPKETGSYVFSSRKLQHATIKTATGECVVVNFHGLWNAAPKTDTPERLEQSRTVKAFLDSITGPKILCGDFNLLPETESIKILEQGMRNLVSEFDIKSTRTPLYRHYDNPAEPNFADYVLVSPEVQVKKFAVLPDVVSDHAPLFLEFC